jgi:hypothetical protein
MVEVEGTEEFGAWFPALSERDAEAVARVGWPLGRKGRGARLPIQHRNQGGSQVLRELRVHSGRPLCVFYAFDPLRRAVPLWRPAMVGSTKHLSCERSRSGQSTSPI